MIIFVKFYLAIAMLNCDTLEIKVAGLALCFAMPLLVLYAGRDDPAGTLIFGAVALVIV